MTSYATYPEAYSTATLVVSFTLPLPFLEEKCLDVGGLHRKPVILCVDGLQYFGEGRGRDKCSASASD